MAISASSVWEIRADATAGNVNGGFFVTGASGTDYSQQAAAQYNLTGVTTAGADAILLSASAAADMVGNAAHIISGTNFTAGWYEITSVVAGVSITLDRTCTTGAGSVGVVNIGGAISLGAANDDAVFENAVAGNKFWMKQGTYTLGGTVSTAAAGSATVKIEWEGYATTRGDKPKGSTRPTIVVGGTSVTTGASWHLKNLIFTSASGFVCLTLGNNNVASHVKAISTDASADRAAFYLNTDASLINCEAINNAGRGINAAGQNTLVNCYIHDCKTGITLGSTSATTTIVGCIFENIWSIAIDFASACTAHCLVMDNTIYGAQNKLGTGISFVAGCTDMRVINNLIYGCVTGVTHGTAGQTIGYDDYNAYYNNTTNATNWTLGPHSITSAYSFTNAAQVTGTTATTASSILTDSGANFANVVANQDYCYVKSGTSVTARVYLITAKTGTTITLSPAIGDSATGDIVYQVTTGRNFNVATASVIGTASPTAFPGGLTTSYGDIGAVQTQYGSGEASGGGSTSSLSFGSPGFGL